MDEVLRAEGERLHRQEKQEAMPCHSARLVTHVGLSQIWPGQWCQEAWSSPARDARAHSSREETKAQRGDSSLLEVTSMRQLAKASGSKQEQDTCSRLLGAPGGSLDINVPRLPSSKKAEGSVTLGRLLPPQRVRRTPHQQLQASGTMHRPGEAL